MSFLKKLKGAFKSGVKFSADVSDSFNWRQGEIPVSLTFTGNPEKESTIEKIEFTIRKPTSGGEPDQNSPYYKIGRASSRERAQTAMPGADGGRRGTRPRPRQGTRPDGS